MSWSCTARWAVQSLRGTVRVLVEPYSHRGPGRGLVEPHSHWGPGRVLVEPYSHCDVLVVHWLSRTVTAMSWSCTALWAVQSLRGTVRVLVEPLQSQRCPGRVLVEPYSHWETLVVYWLSRAVTERPWSCTGWAVQSPISWSCTGWAVQSLRGPARGLVEPYSHWGPGRVLVEPYSHCDVLVVCWLSRTVTERPGRVLVEPYSHCDVLTAAGYSWGEERPSQYGRQRGRFPNVGRQVHQESTRHLPDEAEQSRILLQGHATW